MSEHHLQASEMDHAEEVLDVVLPSVHESAEVVHPGEETFHLPSSSVAAQRSSVLGFAAVAAVGRDHLDAVFLFHFPVESVGVIGLVAD